MSSTPPSDPDTLRGLLDAFIERQMEAGKWLLASLLVVNGGAIVALLSNATYGMQLLAVSGTPFLIGTILAFLAGAASWFVSNTYVLGLRQQLNAKFYAAENLLTAKVVKGADFVGAVILIVTSVGSLIAFGYGAMCATSEAPKLLVKAAQTAAKTTPVNPT